MKVALAQINPIVGDVSGNIAKILGAMDGASRLGADLVVTPELAVLGYPAKDMLLKEHLIRQNEEALQVIAAASKDVAILVGCVAKSQAKRGKPLKNVAALCVGGRVASVHAKRLLPTYDVFDEHRYFEPADQPQIASLNLAGGFGGKVGISICEDLWDYELVQQRNLYGLDPVADLAKAGADLLLNIAASPYGMGKQEQRVKIFSGQAAKHRLPLVYVNQVGGNDDLVFDGASAVFGRDGSILAQARAFEEDLLVVDLAGGSEGNVTDYPGSVDAVYAALVLGTRDYVNKCGFSAVLLGLSGGIDSAVTAVIAAEALGADRVHGIALPSRYSSDHSLDDAHALAENLKIDLATIPIESIHQAMEKELAPHFGGSSSGVAEENIQARIRGNLLMALSNKRGWLLLTTGNKSELAVGYCTLYGDMCGGLALLSDVPKTTVYELARYINERSGHCIIPINTIEKPPSAELKPDQTDQDTLPPYDVLDDILQRYVEQEQSIDQIAAAGFDGDTVKRVVGMVDRNEYKRKQTAVGIKVTSRAFGTGRRMPIAAKYS